MKTEKECYEILGLKVGASDEEVKSSYRELVKQNHPDKNNSPEAKEKFIQVQQAYESIVNKNFARPQNQNHGVFNGFDDFFSQFGGFGFPPFPHQQVNQQTQNKYLGISIDFIDACLGSNKIITYSYKEQCEECADYFKKNNKLNIQTCHACGGSGMMRKSVGPINITQPCGNCGGAGSSLLCGSCNGSGVRESKKQISIKIDAGIEDGQNIRLSKQGDYNYKLNQYGDLFLRVSVLPHPSFTRNGLHIFSKQKINYVDCILGTELEIQTIHGKTNVIIPPLTNHGTVVMKQSGGIKNEGNHYLTVEIDIPEKLTNEEKKLLDKIRKSKLQN